MQENFSLSIKVRYRKFPSSMKACEKLSPATVLNEASTLMPSAKCVHENVMLVSHYKIIIFTRKHMQKRVKQENILMNYWKFIIPAYIYRNSERTRTQNFCFIEEIDFVHVFFKRHQPTSSRETKRLKTFRLYRMNKHHFWCCACVLIIIPLPFICHALIIHRFHYYYESLCICFAATNVLYSKHFHTCSRRYCFVHRGEG